MTRLDKERKKKKDLGKLSELIDNLGQDSEDKGSKVALELFEQEKKENELKDIKTHEKLDHARKKKIDDAYFRMIYLECQDRMNEFHPPMGFRWIHKVSKDGLAIFIQAPDRQQYGGGVKITGDPYVDAKGIVGLVRQAIIDIDLLEEQWKIQSSIKTKN